MFIFSESAPICGVFFMLGIFSITNIGDVSMKFATYI